ncbi:hypothetical protein fgpv_239 [Flamingopox virus FGPVKD09]|uniref:Uncharacterized protein n=1 Tax=Flamingopox virus FGPVKD09 TaxID=2059380 RepID=A0A2H4X2N2_9POXV|nr:hypothetical protein C1178_gp239 [Flamingopox virus FGPVKD09]AUD40330.1 hypothetical protein fgpv_239 [Flamingopox virus FGPVKD09]
MGIFFHKLSIESLEIVSSKIVNDLEIKFSLSFAMYTAFIIISLYMLNSDKDTLLYNLSNIFDSILFRYTSNRVLLPIFTANIFNISFSHSNLYLFAS